MPGESFYQITVGNILSILSVAFVYIRYRQDERKRIADERTARELFIEEQAIMHNENQRRLEILIKFQQAQEEINHKRDEQVGELKIQTATIVQMARGFERRLEMVEDSRRKNRD